MSKKLAKPTITLPSPCDLMRIKLIKTVFSRFSFTPSKLAYRPTSRILATLCEIKKIHAKNVEIFVRKIISEFNFDFGKDLVRISEKEESEILEAILNHSDNLLVELMKDVDSFDRFLHGIKTKIDHLTRAQNFGNEIGIEIVLSSNDF
jgi:hypothetical protein